MLQLSKKWTIAGVIIAIAGLFLHPDQCHSVNDIFSYVGVDPKAGSNIAVIVGCMLSMLGNGITHPPTIQK